MPNLDYQTDIRHAWQAFFDRPVPNFVLRLALMMLGMACIAFSVACTRATDLGTPTISCVPAVLSFATSASIGTWTFIVNLLFIAAQVVLLRREFKWPQLLTIAFVFVFSLLIDLFVPVGQAIPKPNYAARLLISFAACFLTAFGVWLQTKAALVMLPGDGIVQAISHVSGKAFGSCKLGFDITMIVLGTAISLATMGALHGVREGTLLAAVLVGPIIRGIEKLCPNFERFAPTQGHISLIPQ